MVRPVEHGPANTLGRIQRKPFSDHLRRGIDGLSRPSQRRRVLSSSSTIRVRYSETDMMGVVYHGSYIPWLEVARTDLFRQFGLSYRQLESEGYRLPVLAVNCQYFRPAVYDDEIEIKVVSREKPRIRIKLEYELRRGEERIATATTEHAFVDRSGQPTRPPAVFTQLITDHF